MAIRSELDCISCLFAQAVRAVRIAGLSEVQGRELLVELGGELRRMDPDRSPPENGLFLYRRLAELSGTSDPFAAVKAAHTDAALALVPALRRELAAAPDPVDAALRLAAMGNRLDLGSLSTVEEPRELVRRAASEAPGRWDREAFEKALEAGRSFLLVADNAGEIVLDRLLLEFLRRRYPAMEITVVVRGAPVINDATLDDAHAAGIHEVAALMDSGSAIPGFVPGRVSPQARRAFEAADVVLAKGQGNYETLTGCGREVFFLLQVKCPVVERHTGVPRGSSALIREAAGPLPLQQNAAEDLAGG